MDVWNESVLIFKYQLPVDENLIRPTNIIFKKYHTSIVYSYV